MKRVLVYSRLRLVSESIVSLLACSDEIEVMACESDLDTVLRLVRHNHPDVIIVGSDETANGPSPPVLRLWQEGGGARVIELGLEGRVMSVYRVDRTMVTDAADLLRAIECPQGRAITKG